MSFRIITDRLKFPKSIFFFLAGFGFFLAAQAQAQTWLNSPGSNDWNTGANWDTSTVPNSTSALATFGASGNTSVTMSSPVSLDTLQYNASAPAYTLTTNATQLDFFGTGIVNNSAAAQSIYNTAGSQINFYNSSTAANVGFYSGYNSYINFHDTSTAGSASINSNNNDGVQFSNLSNAGTANITNHSGNGLYFYDGSSAASAVINNQGYMYFGYDNAITFSTAGNSTITNTGQLNFVGYSTAGAATITTNSGGYLNFSGNSTGGTSRIAVNGTGYMDISGNSAGLVTVGSLEGSGFVSLGSKDLSTGANNLSTTFSGILSNGGGSGGTGGSLTKIGTGTLTLTGANTYTGGTSILAGTLTVDTGGSLGTGPVTSNANLNYIDNAVAGTVSITTEGNSANLNFLNNASAGYATIYNASQSNVNFKNSSTADWAWIYSGYNSYINFNNNASAGSAIIDSNNVDGLSFNNNSTAASSSITNQGGSYLYFNDASTAANSTIDNQAYLYFYGDSSSVFSTAGNSNITNTGYINFASYATAGAATITTNSGGYIDFNGFANGGTARFSLNGTGYLDISASSSSLVTVGSIEGSGNVSLGGKDLTTGANSLSTTFSGILADGGQSGGTGGSLTKIGTTTLTLTGANTYTGGTTLAGGTLDLGNNNALGTGNLTMETGTTLQSGLNGLQVNNIVALNGNDTFDTNGNNSSLGGVLSGSGSLTKIGSGFLSLDNNSTYSGGTTLSAGGLDVGNSNALGTGSLILSGGTTLQATDSIAVTNHVVLSGVDTLDSDGQNWSISGVISGAGTLAVTNSGGAAALTITGANTYSGGTSITAGAVVVDTGGILGTGAVSNMAATLDYIDNAVAGPGSIYSRGLTVSPYTHAYLDFYNTASAGSAWIYSGYTSYINFYNSSTAANSWIDNNYQDGLYFRNNSTAANAIIINRGNSGINFYNDATAGNSTIDNQTISYIYFYGDGDGVNFSTAGNSNITNTGSIYFQDYSTAAASTITTNSGGYVDFYQHATGGTARFIFNGTGYLDISGISGAPLTIGSLEGSGFVSLGAEDLTTGANSLSTTFTGIIADGGAYGGSLGSLTKIGTTSFTLTGADTYTGGTTILAGTLVAANSDALGTGNVVLNGGTLSLGGPGTLNIGGNYTEGASGNLQLGLGGTTAGMWDTLNITGTATLGGTLTLVSYNNFLIHDNETFTLITASSVSGTFGTVTDGLAGDGVSLVYNPGSVVLDVLATAPPFHALGTTGNQKNVGGALDALTTNASSSALVYYLNGQTNGALPAIFDQISPANLTPLYQMGFGIAQAEGGLVGGRLSELFGDVGSRDTAWNGQGPMFAADMSPSQEAAISNNLQPERWGVFVNGLGDFGTVTGDSNASGYQFSTGGVAAGMDYRFGKDFVGGLLLGYSSSGTSQSTGTVNMTGGQVGLYAGWKPDELHVEALVAGGVNNYTTQRNGVGGIASGSTQGQQFSGQISGGYDFAMDQAKVGPFVSGQYTNVSLNSFTETGSLAPLSFAAQSEGYFSTDLGVKASRKWDLGGFALSPSLNAAWEHVYQGNLDSLSASLGTNFNFSVNGPSTGTDAAVLGAGVNALLGGGFNVYVQYQGKLALTNYTQQDVSGGVIYGF